MATGICTKKFVPIGPVVPEICSQTDRQTDRQTDIQTDGLIATCRQTGTYMPQQISQSCIQFWSKFYQQLRLEHINIDKFRFTANVLSQVFNTVQFTIYVKICEHIQQYVRMQTTKHCPAAFYMH